MDIYITIKGASLIWDPHFFFFKKTYVLLCLSKNKIKG